jgi:hypothetical protein
MEEVSVGFIDWRFFLEILPSHNWFYKHLPQVLPCLSIWADTAQLPLSLSAYVGSRAGLAERKAGAQHEEWGCWKQGHNSPPLDHTGGSTLWDMWLEGHQYPGVLRYKYKFNEEAFTEHLSWAMWGAFGGTQHKHIRMETQ